jgi:hypothetical protein
MQDYEITTIGGPVMVVSHIRKVGPRVWKNLNAQNHPAAALQRRVCDLLSMKGSSVILSIALLVLTSLLAKLTPHT